MSAVEQIIPPHPAKFSAAILEEIAAYIEGFCAARQRIVWGLDPFAGVGGVYTLCDDIDNLAMVGVEIEPEWAAADPRTIVGDSTNPCTIGARSIDLVITSPCYGNRMSDHHDAKDDSRRVSYRHSLGRMPTPGSTAVLPFGGPYRELHRRVYRNMRDWLVRGGLVVVNVSDFVRAKQIVYAADWHRDALVAAGLRLVDDIEIVTRRMRFGENHAARVDAERVLVLRKP